MNEIEKLVRLANELDRKGLYAKADRVDQLIEKLAYNNAPSEKYDLSINLRVKVPKDLYDKYVDPTEIPDDKHLSASGSIVVSERDGYNLKKVYQKDYIEKSLAALKQKTDAHRNQIRAKLGSTPFTEAEEIQFIY